MATKLSLLILLYTLTTALSHAADNAADANIALIKAGRAKAQGCTRCHGRHGIRQAAKTSRFEGSTGAFATRELLAFREGSRNHVIMSGVAKTLSDDDIRAISAWLDSLD